MGTGVIGGAGTGFAGGGATFASFWECVWRETGLLRQIQVVRWVQNPAAQSEFKERTLLRPRTRGQIKLELEHLEDCPVARGNRVYRVEQPWQLYSSLGPRRRAGPAWIAKSGTFPTGFWFVGVTGVRAILT